MNTLINRLRELGAAIRHDDALSSGDMETVRRLSGHCRTLLASPGASDWISTAKRDAITADLKAIDMRDDYERCASDGYLETPQGFRK